MTIHKIDPSAPVETISEQISALLSEVDDNHPNLQAIVAISECDSTGKAAENTASYVNGSPKFLGYMLYQATKHHPSIIASFFAILRMAKAGIFGPSEVSDEDATETIEWTDPTIN